MTKQKTVKSQIVSLSLTPQEKTYYTDLAKRKGISLSQLIRSLLRETYQIPVDNYVFKKEPNCDDELSP